MSTVWKVEIVYPLLFSVIVSEKCYTTGIVFSFMSEKFSPKKLSREVDSTANRSLGRLQAPANLPRANGPLDTSKSLSSAEVRARIAEKRDQINERVEQVKNNPQNDFDRDVLERLNVARAKEGVRRFEARTGKKMTPGVSDKEVLFDRDVRPSRKAHNDVFATKEEKAKNQAVAKMVEAKVKKAREARKMSTQKIDTALSYEQYGVPLQTRAESDRTQEVSMFDEDEDGEFIGESRNRGSRTERELPAYQEGGQKVKESAREIILGLGFDRAEAELMLDKEFCTDLIKGEFSGHEKSLLASVAKEKANDLKAYFKHMGISVDKYGEPDLGTWAKLKGLFGGYNRQVKEIKSSADFKKLALLEMLALEDDGEVMPPRGSSSTFGKKAVMGAAAAAALYGAASGGNKKVESFSSSKPTAEKIEHRSVESRREELPSSEYIFSEEEASLEDGEDDEDFEMTDKRVERAKFVEPAPEKNTLKKMTRIYKGADLNEDARKKEGNMASLEKFFESKEFKNLPKDIRQKMIYGLAGGSIVMDTTNFSHALSNLKDALKKIPDPSKKMSGDETVLYYKNLMQMVDRAVNKK